MKPRLLVVQISAAVFAFSLDRLTKVWVLENLRDVTVMPFINGVMQLRLTANTGMAWSLGHNNATLMTVVASLVTIGLIAWSIRGHKLHPDSFILEKIGAGLMMGGALGNLFDRFTIGQVTDFLQTTFIDFPIFNGADSCIVIGMTLVLIDQLRNSKEPTTAADSDA